LTSNIYPRESELKQITNWDYKLGFKSLFEFIEGVWWTPEWGFRVYRTTDHLWDKKVTGVELHTGGWSGNESIIGALEQNFMFWSMSFWKHYRGGHYYFQIPMMIWNKPKEK
jgi:hypothetical protein